MRQPRSWCAPGMPAPASSGGHRDRVPAGSGRAGRPGTPLPQRCSAGSRARGSASRDCGRLRCRSQACIERQEGPARAARLRLQPGCQVEGTSVGKRPVRRIRPSVTVAARRRRQRAAVLAAVSVAPGLQLPGVPCCIETRVLAGGAAGGAHRAGPGPGAKRGAPSVPRVLCVCDWEFSLEQVQVTRIVAQAARRRRSGSLPLSVRRRASCSGASGLQWLPIMVRDVALFGGSLTRCLSPSLAPPPPLSGASCGRHVTRRAESEDPRPRSYLAQTERALPPCPPQQVVQGLGAALGHWASTWPPGSRRSASRNSLACQGTTTSRRVCFEV